MSFENQEMTKPDTGVVMTLLCALFREAPTAVCHRHLERLHLAMSMLPTAYRGNGSSWDPPLLTEKKLAILVRQSDETLIRTVADRSG
jgi:hypothetical protein